MSEYTAHAYATVDDYERIYGELPDEGTQSIVEAKLEAAATMLDTMVEVDDEDGLQQAVLTIVSCAMVNRVMASTEGGLAGIGEVSYGMGPFSQRASFANPNGDMYLTANERRMLGIGVTAIGSIRPQVGGAPTC